MPSEPRESIVRRRIPGPRRGDKASRGPSWAPAESSSSPSELTARAAPPPNTPAPPPPPPGSLFLPLIPSPWCHKVILRLPSIPQRPLSHATLTDRPSLYLAGPTPPFFFAQPALFPHAQTINKINTTATHAGVHAVCVPVSVI